MDLVRWANGSGRAECRFDRDGRANDSGLHRRRKALALASLIAFVLAGSVFSARPLANDSMLYPGCWSASGRTTSISTAPDRERRRSSSSRVSGGPRSTGSRCSPRSPGSPARAATTVRDTAGASPARCPAMPPGSRRSSTSCWCTRACRLPTCWSATSFGGLTIRLLAARRPQAVAGLVLVDATHERQFQRMTAAGMRMPMAPTGRTFVIANHWLVPSSLPETLKPLAQRLALAPKAIRTLYGELGRMRYSALQVGSIRRTPEVPVVVLTRGPRRDSGSIRAARLDGTWLDLQRNLARSMKNARFWSSPAAATTSISTARAGRGRGPCDGRCVPSRARARRLTVDRQYGSVVLELTSRISTPLKVDFAPISAAPCGFRRRDRPHPRRTENPGPAPARARHLTARAGRRPCPARAALRPRGRPAAGVPECSNRPGPASFR